MVAGALARAISRRGHISRLAAAALDPVPLDGGAQWVPLEATDPIERFSGLPMPLPTARSRKLLAEEVRAADAVIVHDALYSTSLIAAHMARKLGKPWMLIQHIGEIPFPSAVLRGVLGVANALVTKPMLCKAPQAVFISDTVRRHFGELGFSAQPKLLFNGVDSAHFRAPENGERELLRDRFGFAPDRKTLLFVGRFVEKKGLSILRELAGLRPDLDLALVGSGPIDPAAWSQANVHLLGRKDRTELAELYRAADALVLPSVGEGFPLVIQEAMASGLPILCGSESALADPGATRYLTGIEIDIARPGATAERLAAALDSTSGSRRKEAADYARRHYDWNTNAEWIEARFNELLDPQYLSSPQI